MIIKSLVEDQQQNTLENIRGLQTNIEKFSAEFVKFFGRYFVEDAITQRREKKIVALERGNPH